MLEYRGGYTTVHAVYLLDFLYEAPYILRFLSKAIAHTLTMALHDSIIYPLYIPSVNWFYGVKKVK